MGDVNSGFGGVTFDGKGIVSVRGNDEFWLMQDVDKWHGKPRGNRQSF